MPLYTWICKKNQFKIEVIRNFTEYERPPEKDELPKDQQELEHEWERIIWGTQTLIKWPNSTGPVKGRN